MRLNWVEVMEAITLGDASEALVMEYEEDSTDLAL